MRYRVIAEDSEASRQSQEPVEVTWEGDADSPFDAVTRSGFIPGAVLDVQKLSILDEEMVNNLWGGRGYPEEFFPGIKELHARYERLHAEVIEHVVDVSHEDIRAITLFNLCKGMDSNRDAVPELIVPKEPSDSITELLWQQSREGLLDVEWDEEQDSPRFTLTKKGNQYAQDFLGVNHEEQQ